MKFDFIALSMGCAAVCWVSVFFVVGIYFFVKKSLATRSVLLKNHLNTSSAPFSALSWHLLKKEVWKDKNLPTLCPTFTAIRVLLIYNTGFSSEKSMCFPINTFYLSHCHIFVLFLLIRTDIKLPSTLSQTTEALELMHVLSHFICFN